jgi:hypothetical protein
MMEKSVRVFLGWRILSSLPIGGQQYSDVFD